MMATSIQLDSDPTIQSSHSGSSSKIDIKTIIIGVSGPSSSGKTTLARLLRDIFTIPPSSSSSLRLSLFIIHEDDFYKTDRDIPVKTVSSRQHGTRDLQDWDCVESLNLELLGSTLNHVKETGSLPPEMMSKEDQNETGESGVSDDVVRRLHGEMKEWLEKGTEELPAHSTEIVKELRLFVLDGILLYPNPSLALAKTQPREGADLDSASLQSSEMLLGRLHSILDPLLSLRLFLPCTREQMITRRNARSGYVTLEGFWTDPPGYVEDVVWPNFINSHGWMFRRRGHGSGDQDVSYASGYGGRGPDVDETEFDEERIGRAGIQVLPGGGQLGMTEILEWAVRSLKRTIAGLLDLPLPSLPAAV